MIPTRQRIATTRGATGVCITIVGRFDFSCHQDFRKAYESIGPVPECQVDLKDTEYIDSSALGMLLLLREAYPDTVVKIQNATPSVKKILQIANFGSLFKIV